MVYYVGNSLMAQGMRACRESRGVRSCDECGCGSSMESDLDDREVNQQTGQIRKKMTYHSYEFPTERQVSALRFITMFTSKVFEGKTKEEAKRFISEHMDFAIKEKQRYEWY